MRKRYPCIAAVLLIISLSCTPSPSEPDLLIVGAGIAGLSAALEAADHGLDVEVIDMWSVFGGHAVQSGAVLLLVDTPFQRARGIEDSPDLAYSDFIRFGEDADPHWARTYSEESGELYEWLVGLGVEFEDLMRPPGNSVFRTHMTKGRGRGLVTPIYLATLERPNIAFHWNQRATRLIRERDRIVGVETRDLRTGETRHHRGGAVLLATGGFQSNMELVRQYWRDDIPFPEHFLVGAGINAHGSGLELATGVGGALSRLDHQWNYATGMRDPRRPGQWRALNVFRSSGIWVNLEGERFINESLSARETLPAVIQQRDSTYWLLFDEPGRALFKVSGTDWVERQVIDELIFDDRDTVKRGNTIAELAVAADLSVETVAGTVARYNRLVALGSDTDFSRFGPGVDRRDLDEYAPAPISQPPFYAVQFYPMTRKSMGGVAVDHDCRVTAAAGQPIPGLYAAGEVTGFGGINGRAGLEGTFLGPSMLMGRVTARAVAVELAIERPVPAPSAPRPSDLPEPVGRDACLACHPLPDLIGQSRPGFLHFESAHSRVVDLQLDCNLCHSEIDATTVEHNHTIDRRLQADTCGTCH